MTPVEEHTLIGEAQRGDLQALDELLRRYERPLFRHVHRMMKTEDQAYDALQQTFLVIAKSISRLRRRDLFRPWAYGVATRICLKALSRRGRDLANSSALEDDGPAATVSPEQMAQTLQERAVLLERVLTLSPPVRSVLLLHFYEGMSLSEVAAALEISLGTVKSRLSAGLRKLRSFEEVKEYAQGTRTRS